MDYSSDEINAIPKEKRLEYINNEIFKGNTAIGRVECIKQGNDARYTFVQLLDVCNIRLINTLDGEPWRIYCSFRGLLKEVEKEIKEGSLISFQVVLSDNQIIKVKSSTVEILENYESLLDRIGLEYEDLDICEVLAREGVDGTKVWIRKEFSNRIQEMNKNFIQQIADNKAVLEDIKKNQEAIKEEIAFEKARMEEECNKLHNIKKRLANFGFVEFNEEIDTKKNLITNFKGNYLELFHYIEGYIRNNEELIYTEDIIRRFLIALQCNELVVFTGPSGTGKTSIVKAFAKAFDGVAKIIAVKPNWTDSEDLLGFYNPVEKSYVSTPFLDAIVEAKKQENRNKIYLICLDEMNLAHIEYYFAEFLSKLEEKSVSPVIELYSEEIYNDILQEIAQTINLMEEQNVGLTLQEMQQWCQNNINKYPIEISKLSKKIKFIQRYPARFEVPNNVRFIGTLNVDQTTKSISPKVIDRSFVIELLSNDKEDLIIGEKIEQQHITIEQLINSKQAVVSTEIKIDNEIYELNNLLNKISIGLNYRGKQHIRKYVEYAQCYINDKGLGEFSKNGVLGDIIYSKMLPRFNVNIKSLEDKKALNWQEFRNKIQEIESEEILNKVNKMNEEVEQDNILSFWSVY